MYRPAHFRVDDPATCHALMQTHDFAVLTTVDSDGVPFATHVQLLLAADEGPGGTLYGHLARANPQWRHFSDRRPALAVFSGPHAYVSPRGYASAPNVPTWNYAVVHAYGVPSVMEAADEVAALMARLGEVNEGPGGWRLQDEPETYVQGMLRGIVAFRIPLDRLEGKWKMSQNRKDEDRTGVADWLDRSGAPGAGETAAIMRNPPD